MDATFDERTHFLGGSEIAAALGLSRYMTPLQLWAIKTGQIQPEDVSAKLQVRLGHKLEQTVAELFEEETGKKVHRVNEELRHPNYSFLRGHIDRRVVGENAVLEIKTTGSRRIMKEFDDDIPTEFLIQTLYYMTLMEAPKGYIACLFGNSDFRVKEVFQNPELQSDIIRRAATFWVKFVEPKTMPIAITKDDGQTLYELFPEGDESQEIILGEEANRLLDNLIAMGKDCESLINQMNQSKNSLKALLQDHAVGKTDRYYVTWKSQKRQSLNAALLKKDLPDLYDEYTVETGMRVLRYGERGEK